MKRSKAVTLTILAALVATGCDDEVGDVKHCVDENDVVHEESFCDPDGGDPDASVQVPVYDDHGVITHYTYMPRSHFHWYYINSGSGGHIYSPGSKVRGGSYTPSIGRSYSPPSSITRGGFGGLGHGFSGGGE